MNYTSPRKDEITFSTDSNRSGHYLSAKKLFVPWNIQWTWNRGGHAFLGERMPRVGKSYGKYSWPIPQPRHPQPFGTFGTAPPLASPSASPMASSVASPMAPPPKWAQSRQGLKFSPLSTSPPPHPSPPPFLVRSFSCKSTFFLTSL